MFLLHHLLEQVVQVELRVDHERDADEALVPLLGVVKGLVEARVQQRDRDLHLHVPVAGSVGCEIWGHVTRSRSASACTGTG